MTNDEIVEYVNNLEKETKAIKEETLRICWYMRGGLTYDEAMYLSGTEKEIINKIVESNLETTKKSGMPFF